MTETPWKVLSSPLPEKQNFFSQDPVLQRVIERLVRPETAEWLRPQAERLGAQIPSEIEWRAALCDRETPVLVRYDRYGQRIDEVRYRPEYREMEQVAYGSGMVGLKYDPALRERFGGDLQVAGFALAFLFAQGDSGLSCPVCMTDGVARVLELYASKEQQERCIPRLASTDVEQLLTGAMFLTEKQGGSDVGQNATRAVKQADGSWRLYGQKWFCSNVDAGLKLVLARPEDAPGGTRGLGLFLVPHVLPDGTRNPIRIERLKDKLGVRSMASGETVFEGAHAELVGELDAGFKQMAEMLNLSRLWNAVCSISIARRAAFEATVYLRSRHTFGKAAIEHGLVREMLADIQAEVVGGQALVFQLAHHLDAADRGAERDAALVRILTPLAKYTTAKTSVWAASEGIELVGGNGYIEDSPMPRLLRDAQVLPVWEGTTNILVLDTLRVVAKTAAHEVLVDETRQRCEAAHESLKAEAAIVAKATGEALSELAVIAQKGPDAAAGRLRRFTDRLLYAYEISLLLDPAYQQTPEGPIFAAAARRLIRRWLDDSVESPPEDIAALVDATVVEA